MLENQITDKSKKGIGYHVVALPHPLSLNAPTKLDLSYSGLDKFKEPEFNKYCPWDTVSESTIDCDKESDNSKENTDDSLEKDKVTDNESSSVESLLKFDRETIIDWKEFFFILLKKESLSNLRMMKNQLKRQLGMLRCIDHNVLEEIREIGMSEVQSTRKPRVVNIARPYRAPVNAVRENGFNAARANGFNVVKPSACWVWRPIKPNGASLVFNKGKPQMNDKGFVDSGCSRHMTGNIAYLTDFKEYNGGYTTFGGGAYGGRITGKGTLKTNCLDFEDVYYIDELKFNLFSVSQICDKKNYVLFTDTECLVLSPNFKLSDKNQILLRIPREDNMRLGHINFKNINKLVKENLVRGLPLKRFENDQTCVACLKGKQYRASCKSKVLNPITKALFMLHMDLFGPTFVSSLMHKKYCLVVTNDYSRFIWVFFLATKDETSKILKNFIIQIENLVDQKVKIIRCDNGTEFKNKVMDAFCKEKGIKREYSIARTPQQNGVAERRNRTLIEAARTMLADSKLPTTFWAEAVSTACYVQNRVLIVKPHNKTPYELFRGIKPALSFMKPFGCHVTILNTLDSLGKFDGKSDEGFFVGYSLSSKSFRVYNTRTKKVEENLHIRFLDNKPMIEGNGPKWLFDIDSLTQSMNYVPVTAGTSTNESVGTQEDQNADTFLEKHGNSQDCIVMPIWKDASYFDFPSKQMGNDDPKSVSDEPKENKDGSNDESNGKEQSQDDNSTKQDNIADQPVNTASSELNTGGIRLNTVGSSVNTATIEDMVGPSHSLESLHDEDDTEVDLGNILNFYTVPTTPHTRIHINHPLTNVIGDILSPEEPKRISKALTDPAWVEAMQEELLQFKLQNVWILVDLPKGRRAIGSKWVFRNKKDERGIVIRNKARLIEEEVYVCQPPGFKDPDYPDKVYKVMKALYGLHQALRAWYETLTNYLLGNGFHRGKIDQILFIKKHKRDILLVQIYVNDIIFGSTKKELCIEFEKLMKDKFQMSSMGELTFFLGLQVQQRKDGIFINQDKYVAEILSKFNYTNVKTASTPVDLERPLVKDRDAEDVDVHLYRSMIGSLMYLTTSRPDILFDVCACARFQVTPKTSYLLVVKRIFRYLKGKPTLDLWYSRNSPFESVAYTDSDYAEATQDRKSTTGGCQFLGNRLISWQCKKQTMVSKLNMWLLLAVVDKFSGYKTNC
ncbi:retrovirus-related pol polyprotein from transposon TNT 1-94 [Tanacetum coccineum]